MAATGACVRANAAGPAMKRCCKGACHAALIAECALLSCTTSVRRKCWACCWATAATGDCTGASVAGRATRAALMAQRLSRRPGAASAALSRWVARHACVATFGKKFASTLAFLCSRGPVSSQELLQRDLLRGAMQWTAIRCF